MAHHAGGSAGPRTMCAGAAAGREYASVVLSDGVLPSPIIGMVKDMWNFEQSWLQAHDAVSN